jgi:hypothetical protein
MVKKRRLSFPAQTSGDVLLFLGVEASDLAGESENLTDLHACLHKYVNWWAM